MNHTAFGENTLNLIRNYEQACRAIHQRVSEECGPMSTAALVMDARADTAKTLGDEVEAELALFKLGVPPARAEAPRTMPTTVTKMMWPEAGGAL